MSSKVTFHPKLSTVPEEGEEKEHIDKSSVIPLSEESEGKEHIGKPNVMPLSEEGENGYAKLQCVYVQGKDGKVIWERIYQNLKIEPTYAELSFTQIPMQGKNDPSTSTHAEEHTYAKLINVIKQGSMVGRPLPPVPREDKNNLSILTHAEEHYDWPKVSYVWMDPIYKNANYVREHIYETINNKAQKIPPSEKKVGLIKRMKNMLWSIKDFFMNLFKSKKPPINRILRSVNHGWIMPEYPNGDIGCPEVNWSEIHHHGSSYVRFDNCDAVISSNRQKAVSGDRPNSDVKELNIAQNTTIMSTYC